ncbi:hypothetical protein JQC67_12715 [Aurantibacter crassamenti]|uniref:hypothetical protein n=1 Tax=Aurantibacter crassamenti TaxID=1837375 RepID=UPI00193ACEE5|nr:hypothetical protein [Aurantibacter crassamenti]MBM1107006.1 hypothetical protein [Aurantibacter crassamenti]
MENTLSSGQFHEIIKTKHVFTEDNQVFLKQEIEDNTAVEWFPTNFYWKPNR